MKLSCRLPLALRSSNLPLLIMDPFGRLDKGRAVALAATDPRGAS